MAENFEKQEPAKEAQVNQSLFQGFKIEEAPKNTANDQVQQVAQAGDSASSQIKDSGDANKFSASDMKVASSDPEVNGFRANLGDSAKAIQGMTDRLSRGPSAPEGQELLKNMIAQMQEHYSGTDARTGQPRGNAQMLTNLVKHNA